MCGSSLGNAVQLTWCYNPGTNSFSSDGICRSWMKKLGSPVVRSQSCESERSHLVTIADFVVKSALCLCTDVTFTGFGVKSALCLYSDFTLTALAMKSHYVSTVILPSLLLRWSQQYVSTAILPLLVLGWGQNYISALISNPICE